MQSYPMKGKTAQDTMKSVPKFVPQDQKPGLIHTENSLEFHRACEDLCWDHVESTPYRSETNEIAEHAVCRVKEGTSALLVQSFFFRILWHLELDMYFNPISTKDKSRLHQHTKMFPKKIHRIRSEFWRRLDGRLDLITADWHDIRTTSRPKFTSRDSSPKK